MDERTPRVAVTPPAFCKSPSLKTELLDHFPNAAFNEKDRYLAGPELVDFLADADAALIGRDSITAELIHSLPKLIKMRPVHGQARNTLRLSNV